MLHVTPSRRTTPDLKGALLSGLQQPELPLGKVFGGKWLFHGPAHLSTQWAAVTTQFLWMRDPPQV